MANTRKIFCVLEIRYIYIDISIKDKKLQVFKQIERFNRTKKKKENGKHKECLCVLETHDSLTFNGNEQKIKK